MRLASHSLRESGTSSVSNSDRTLDRTIETSAHCTCCEPFGFTESFPALTTSGTLSEEAGSDDSSQHPTTPKKLIRSQCSSRVVLQAIKIAP